MSIEQTFKVEENSGPSLVEEAAALDAANAEKAKAAPTDTDRPDWLPEQFKTIEDFNKSYTDGRAEITRLQQELAALKKTEPPKEGEQQQQKEGEPKPGEEKKPEDEKPKTPEELEKAPADEQQKAAEEAAKNAGVDTTPYAEEFTQTGDVSPESREKLYEAFKPQFGEAAKNMVDGYIEGQKALASNYKNAAMQEAGGEDNYAAMQAWAKDNMSADEKAAYNRAVESRDVNATILAIRGLKQTYENANGRAPNLVNGDNTIANSSAITPFASSKEMTDAINDPRYAADPAYRSKVMARIQAA